jgi:hypothetical protein
VTEAFAPSLIVLVLDYRRAVRAAQSGLPSKQFCTVWKTTRGSAL